MVQEDRTSSSDAVDLGSIPELGQPKRFSRLVFTVSLNRDSVEKNLASLLVMSLGKTLKGNPPALSGRQLAINKRTDIPMQ